MIFVLLMMTLVAAIGFGLWLVYDVVQDRPPGRAYPLARGAEVAFHGTLGSPPGDLALGRCSTCPVGVPRAGNRPGLWLTGGGWVTELCGVLREDIRFPALVRFVTSLGKSGCLQISEGHWIGELSIAAGRVVAASFASQRGLVALDAMVLALPNGRFTFSAGAPVAERDVDLSPDELQAYVDGLATKYARLNTRIPSLAAVPQVVAPDDQAGLTSTLTLERRQLAILLGVDGRRTVGEIAAHRGLIETVSALAALIDLGLIRVDSMSPEVVATQPLVEASPALAPPPVSQTGLRR